MEKVDACGTRFRAGADGSRPLQIRYDFYGHLEGDLVFYSGVGPHSETNCRRSDVSRDMAETSSLS